MTSKQPGLTSTQIKLIGAFFMTLGNLVPYGYTIPIVSRFSVQLGLLGKIALPLFLYMLTESVHYTRSKPRFLLRLYVAAVGVGLFTAVTNVCTGSTVGIYRQNNILFTYFYTAVYIVMIEKILYGFSHRTVKEIAIGMASIGATILIHFFIVLVWPIVAVTGLGGDLFESFLVSPVFVEETPVVILVGILLYFLKAKWQKASLIGLAALLSQSRLLAQLCFSTPMTVFFNGPQLFMILAVPIMLLYNGKRGSEKKAFFYCYYPLHRYVIAIIKFAYRF